MDQYQHIRYLYAVEGLSQREIARKLGISRNTVKRYCRGENVPWERAKTGKDCSRVITPAVRDFVQKCLDYDKTANPKQRHTSKRIYDRLREKLGFHGGESTIRYLVSQMRAKQPEVFIPLAFSPGEAAQVDWGEATVVIAGEKAKVSLFCLRLCYSCTPFVMAYPSQREEIFLEAHQQAFEYFGGVPQVLLYDNLKTAVKEGFGRAAREQDKFLAFRAHYAYEARFCNIAEGHEKGLVENLVGYIRRNVLVPVPAVQDWDELNELIQKRCRSYLAEQHIRGREMSVKDSFAVEKPALTPLPVKSYEAGKLSEPRVDHYSTVPFDKNRYSVPVAWAGHTVTVRGSAFKVEVYHRGELIAHHNRSYGRNKTCYELSHYLSELEKKPRSVFNARPVREAHLPEELFRFTKMLKNPDRAMVKLLRLVVDYGVEKVLQAIEQSVEHNQYSIEILHYYIDAGDKANVLDISGPSVDTVDLRRYDILLSGGACS